MKSLPNHFHSPRRSNPPIIHWREHGFCAYLIEHTTIQLALAQRSIRSSFRGERPGEWTHSGVKPSFDPRSGRISAGQTVRLLYGDRRGIVVPVVLICERIRYRCQSPCARRTNHRYDGSGLVEGQGKAEISTRNLISVCRGPLPGVASPNYCYYSLLRFPFGPCASDQEELAMA